MTVHSLEIIGTGAGPAWTVVPQQLYHLMITITRCNFAVKPILKSQEKMRCAVRLRKMKWRLELTALWPRVPMIIALARLVSSQFHASDLKT